MIYEELKMNLFDLPKHYTLAHCIATDAKMGKGIATQFVRRYGLLRSTLQNMDLEIGQVIGYHETYNTQVVLNMITKFSSYDKPSRGDFNRTVLELKRVCLEYGITHLGIPKIGSGKDKLSWKKSKEYIMKVFEDTDIDIIVCIQ